ncbi:LrgB family protein [Gracilibacillus sp. HCP3S3_G5_2]
MVYLLKVVSIIVINVIIFLVMRKLYQKYYIAIFNPVITTTLIIILLLVILHIPYETYMIGGKWINSLLGPAVVAFAFPLYQHRKLLIKYLLPIISAVTTATFIGMISGYFMLLHVFAVETELALSIIPKSLTIPVAMQVATEIGGTASLTAVCTMFAGSSGIIIGPIIMNYLGVNSNIGIGVGLGTSSQAVGVAKALEHSKMSSSIGTVSMVLTAIIGSLTAPLIPIIFNN